jgi:superfamily II DNA or RNA helicase
MDVYNFLNISNEIISSSNYKNNIETEELKQKHTNKINNQNNKDIINDYNSFTKKNNKDIINDYNSFTKKNNNIQLTKSGGFIKFELFENFNGEMNTELHSNIKKIINKLTLKYKTITEKIEQVKRYKIDLVKNRLIVPRFITYELLQHNKKYGIKNNCGIDNLINEGNEPEIKFEWAGKLTNNQNVIINHIMNNIYNQERYNNGSAGCILNLEAGQGKSYVAANLISKIQKKTAIILHSSSILGQWKSLLSNLFKNKIGAYYSKEKTDGDIVLLIINSALSDNFIFKDNNGNEKELSALEFHKQFGFVIYDECHEYCNKWAGRIFNIAQSKYVLGLSATPDEHLKGYDKIIKWELGPILIANQLNGFSIQDTKFKANINRIMYYGPPDYTKIIKNESLDVVSASSTITMLSYDPYRIRIILDCIKSCLNKNLYTFVFADRKGYLEVIRRALIEELTIEHINNKDNKDNSANNNTINNVDNNTINNVDNNNSIEFLYDDNDYQRIVGGANEQVFKNAETKSRVIFTTYQYMGTGKSIIKMNGLIMITPRKSKLKQYYNRIFRLGSDASIIREIYMIVDMKTLFARHWTYHKKYCNEMEYIINEEKIQYSKIKPVKMKPEWSILLRSNGKLKDDEIDDDEFINTKNINISISITELENKKNNNIINKSIINNENNVNSIINNEKIDFDEFYNNIVKQYNNEVI